MKQHITRAYNSFSIDSSLGTITKRSRETRLFDEINYYKDIETTPHSIFFPRFRKSSHEDGEHSMELEYYAYNNLGDYMVYEDFDQAFWENVASGINDALDSFVTTHKNDDFTAYAEAMYIGKTERYYKELLENPKFAVIATHQKLIIDGRSYANFHCLWNQLQELIRHYLTPLRQLSVIHGDFCFSNILCGVNAKTQTHLLKFVDPRGHFGEDGVFGDPLYDIAKLVHSFEGGYEYIIFDEFELEENKDLNHFQVTFANDNKEKIKKVFNKFDRFRDNRAKLIQGLIYIGMCSRHYDSLPRQTVMYTTGIKLLNEALDYEDMR